MLKHKLYDYFDRCYVVNLPKRIDRLSQFQNVINALPWPFREIEVFKAIEGDKVGVPDEWQTGGGSWGCMQSHRQIVERCLMEDVKTVLIMEDDCIFRPQFNGQVETFLNAVPANWDALWIGGQYHDSTWENGKRRVSAKRVAISDNVVKTNSVERTHCYALRGSAIMKELYRVWHKSPVHCDWVLGSVQEKFNVYCPNPFLACQRDGHSDIAGREKPTECWSDKPQVDFNAPIVWLRDTPREVMETLRPLGFHAGKWRDWAGRDKGLNTIFDPLKTFTELERTKKLKNEWLSVLHSEAATNRSVGIPNVVTIWHDQAIESVIRAACPNVIELVNPTVEQALQTVKEKGLL